MVGLMGAWREAVVSALVEHGLAAEDGERQATRFIEGVADCFLEVMRKDYEVRGKSGAELTWTQAIAYVGLNRVQSAAVPCVVNVGQQSGVPVSADFGTAGSRADDIPARRPSPPWAADMETRIRRYVASRSVTGIETVLVECSENGCTVALVGHDIRVFDLELDGFAEQNGFQSVALSGDAHLRLVWLPR
jgi:hypothetical protein